MVYEPPTPSCELQVLGLFYTLNASIYVQGGGCPVIREILITATYDFEEKKKITKFLAGIEE
jgi:hypothetical protein